MSIFNEFFKKEKPIFTGLKFGFGSGGGGAAATPTVQATGGNAVLTPGNGYKYHYFTTPGSLVVSNAGPGQIDYLIVGGGGSGGNGPDTGAYQGAGGGGAGKFLTGQITTLQAATYPVTIGTGGLHTGGPKGDLPYPGNTGWYGGNGLASEFNSPSGNGVSVLPAAGGGSGGGGTNDDTGENGQPGGSAGGGGGYAGSSENVAGTGDPYPGSGNTFPSPPNGWGSDATGASGDGAGGGGAGEAGGGTPPFSPPTSYGPGGDGLPAFDGDTGIPSDYGTAHPTQPGRWFAAGGGGGRNSVADNPFPGGIGGGGAGGVEAPNTGRHGQHGLANTGSGGGGCGSDIHPGTDANGKGGNGGPGIVIIRYTV